MQCQPALKTQQQQCESTSIVGLDFSPKTSSSTNPHEVADRSRGVAMLNGIMSSALPTFSPPGSELRRLMLSGFSSLARSLGVSGSGLALCCCASVE